uniref:Uncharacterized protein n=1 Tax=Anguilla anguilla TaxID=7936 RepID=A0A0E9XRG3_ANGAN
MEHTFESKLWILVSKLPKTKKQKKTKQNKKKTKETNRIYHVRKCGSYVMLCKKI